MKNRIPLRAVESKSFLQLMKALRPSYTKIPTRNQLASKWLNRLYERTQDEVRQTISQWARGTLQITICFDCWENVKYAHVVNIMAHSNNRTLPLDSIQTLNQPGCQSPSGLDPERHEGLWGDRVLSKQVAAIASDNTASTRNARSLIIETCPGIVALQDQAHAANLLMKDVCKLKFVDETLRKVCTVSTFVRERLLLKALSKRKISYN